MFYSPTDATSSAVLSGITACAFLGAFYGGLGALTQSNVKRFLAYFSVALWSTCLMGVGNPSPSTVAAVVFSFVSMNLALTVVFVVLGNLHGQRRSDDFIGLKGISSRRVFETLILLFALLSLVGLPPMMGFPAMLNLFGALFEQRSLGILLFFVLFLVLLLGIVFRVVATVFFEAPDDRDGLFDSLTGIGIKTRVALAGLLVPLFIFGLFWERLFTALVQRANHFIIP